MVLTQQFEDKVKLLLHGGARKERPSCHHLVEDTADAPGNGNAKAEDSSVKASAEEADGPGGRGPTDHMSMWVE